MRRTRHSIPNCLLSTPCGYTPAATPYILQEAEGQNVLFPTLCRKQRSRSLCTNLCRKQNKGSMLPALYFTFVRRRRNELSTLYSLQEICYCPCKILKGRILYSSLCMNDNGRALYSLTLCMKQKVATSLGSSLLPTFVGSRKEQWGSYLFVGGWIQSG